MQQLLKRDDDVITYSLVIPVYGNEANIPSLLEALSMLAMSVGSGFEAVFVVDGSPDRSYAMLRDALPSAAHHAQLIALSRNFGAFPAIRAGLEFARGRYIAVMSADLQEPPELVLEFFRQLEQGEYDVAFGVRASREDPWLSTVLSRAFWWFYRRMVIRDVPEGGVDIFALRDGFRDELLRLQESNSSLLAQLFWLGGRRLMVDYRRRKREHGKSAWTLAKKFRYLSDSVFSFTDLPIKVMLFLGAAGLACGVLLGGLTLFAKISGIIPVPGYAGVILAVLFFGALNMFGIGIVGTYAWRTYENTKRRPLSLIQSRITF